MPTIRVIGLVALTWIGLPGRASAQTIRRAPLDSVVLPPPALADSTPVYRAALEGALDSQLARTGNSRYYIEIPHEALPAATELIPPIIRTGRARGWCVWDRKDSCLTRGRYALHFGRVILHAAESASIPYSSGRAGDKAGRAISNTANEWLKWRAMEVGIWPSLPVMTDGVFYFLQPPAIALRRDTRGWRVVGLLKARRDDCIDICGSSWSESADTAMTVDSIPSP